MLNIFAEEFNASYLICSLVRITPTACVTVTAAALSVVFSAADVCCLSKASRVSKSYYSLLSFLLPSFFRHQFPPSATSKRTRDSRLRRTVLSLSLSPNGRFQRTISIKQKAREG